MERFRSGPRRARLAIALGALTALLLASAGSSSAAIYAYTDAQGRIRITDIPEKKGYEIVVPPAAKSAQPRAAVPSSYYTPKTAYPSPATRRDPSIYKAFVSEAARLHGISESLIYAVMRAESNFNPNAISRANAQGLMQLIPSTARLVGVINPFDPRQNIMGGSRYLRMMIDRFGRIDHAIAAYNAGPEAVERHKGIPPYSETRSYVPRVLKYYREFSGGRGIEYYAAAARTAPTARKSAVAEVVKPAPAAAAAQPAPIFYYRGPDGQIYITNIGS